MNPHVEFLELCAQNALDTLLQDILAKAEAATGYKIEAEDEDYDYIARMTPETTQALVKICRRAVRDLKNRCYCHELTTRCWACETKVDIEELAKGI